MSTAISRESPSFCCVSHNYCYLSLSVLATIAVAAATFSTAFLLFSIALPLSVAFAAGTTLLTSLISIIAYRCLTSPNKTISLEKRSLTLEEIDGKELEERMAKATVNWEFMMRPVSTVRVPPAPSSTDPKALIDWYKKLCSSLNIVIQSWKNDLLNSVYYNDEIYFTNSQKKEIVSLLYNLKKHLISLESEKKKNDDFDLRKTIVNEISGAFNECSDGTTKILYQLYKQLVKPKLQKELNKSTSLEEQIRSCMRDIREDCLEFEICKRFPIDRGYHQNNELQKYSRLLKKDLNLAQNVTSRYDRNIDLSKDQNQQEMNNSIVAAIKNLMTVKRIIGGFKSAFPSQAKKINPPVQQTKQEKIATDKAKKMEREKLSEEVFIPFLNKFYDFDSSDLYDSKGILKDSVCFLILEAAGVCK